MTIGTEQRPVVLIGGSGHAKVILDIARLTHRTVAGVLTLEDDNALPIATLGNDDRLRDRSFVAAHDFFVALGQTHTRRLIAQTLAEHGATLATLIHPACVVAADVEIGGGTVLVAGVIVNSGSKIGQHCTLNTACSVDHDCLLGDGVQIGPGARLCGSVVCQAGAYIGAGAIVIEGHIVGASAVVGAGATVVTDIAPKTTVVGTPAREMTPQTFG